MEPVKSIVETKKKNPPNVAEQAFEVDSYEEFQGKIRKLFKKCSYANQ